MNVLIVGDSFAADWTVKYPNQQGWPNLLSKKFTITNLAQAGCAEYRIYKQLASVNLTEYDLVLVSHTSPYRIYTEYNPVRAHDKLHHHFDLLYADIEFLAKDNLDYTDVIEYFKKFFSIEYAEFGYKLILKEINQLLLNIPAIQLLHQSDKTLQYPYIDISSIFIEHQGLINHYSDTGNQLVYDIICKEIDNLLK